MERPSVFMDWKVPQMPIFSKSMYRFNAISMKILMFFVDTHNNFLRFVWKAKKIRIAKTLLRKKKKMGGITLLNINAYYIATFIKTAWYW